ncbi:uncharacterized protein TM35_000311600 [Trypanosoma theileri]|uniref:Uncharacterized protein n=1 Tax=Trypanosoma theileri TaxID=67003 RepID=A0A1X0NMM6_9TRYP|nr:uncharacterized protein TM35_000311600 [Trypanosoma theileri]ORC85974.1 hypothetical protein TM35_000311600 [Trypanosoma theileri]
MSMVTCVTTLSNLSTIPQSELQAKYDAAVKRWEVAKKAMLDACLEKDEKKKIAAREPNGTKESYLAWAEYCKTDIAFVDMFEQECAAEYEKHTSYANLMLKQYGVDSNAAQIAIYRVELTRTKEYTLSWSSQYWTKWHQLMFKALLWYWNLKAEASDAEADELEKAKDEFRDRISNESNGKAFYEAWNAVGAALDKWEKTGDRADWDEAKPIYEAEWEKWNEFIPKGEQYAAVFENQMRRLSTVAESELQTQYDEAVKSWEAAKQATKTAKVERDKKEKIAKQIPSGTKESHIAWAEYWEAHITFDEKCEQECCACCIKCEAAAHLMIQRYGVGSKGAQIAMYRADLAYTKEFTWYRSSPYWIKWDRLVAEARALCWKLRAAEFQKEADELDRAKDVFLERIKTSNCEVLYLSHDAAVAALEEWEEEEDRIYWDRAKPIYEAEWEKWSDFKQKGEQYAAVLEKQMQRLATVAEAQVELKYDDAVKRLEIAKEATEGARWEKDEKKKLAKQKLNGTREYFLAWAEYWNAEIEFVERCEQEFAAEYAKNTSYATSVSIQQGAHSTTAEIERCCAELTQAKEFVWWDYCPYWIKWNKLLSKVSLWYSIHKATGCSSAADELEKAKDKFCDRINNESNGKAFREAWNAAVVALDKWEKTGDRTAWNRAKLRYHAEWEKWNEFIPKGEQYASVLEKQMRRLSTVAESQLQVKYYDAVKRWEAAKQATEAAKRERDGKKKIAAQKPIGTMEENLALADSYNTEITFVERCEQECAAEYEMHVSHLNLIFYYHDVDSNAAQIARYLVELTQAKEFVWWDYCPYWIKWNKLLSKVSLRYWQIKAAGWGSAANELEKAKDDFYGRISKKTNGETFREAWNAAVAALDSWEKTGDRTYWDEAKPKYDAELAKWKEFKPKGEQYAAVLEKQTQRLAAVAESELQTQYDDAVKRWEAAKQATEAARWQRDEKEKLAKQKLNGTKEYHLAWEESWNAEIEFVERCEQEFAAEYEMHVGRLNLIFYHYGVDSNASQIARYCVDLTRTKEFAVGLLSLLDNVEQVATQGFAEVLANQGRRLGFSCK